ncbi:MAG: phage tail protein [Flavobacteriales bacterium]|jgi:phage tail-like protein|nr:phage tail protein [Flavobacteriales bacterium]
MSYPLCKFHFQIDWGGSRLSATEVVGLTKEIDVVEYRDGAMPTTTKSLMPGLTKPNRITLKRGVIKGDNEYYNWLSTVKFDKVEKRDLFIKLLDENHEMVMMWLLKNAFPVKLSWSDLKAVSNEPVMEYLEVVYEEMVVRNE